MTNESYALLVAVKNNYGRRYFRM